MNQTMAIEQGKTLRYEKVASFRDKLAVSEINNGLEGFVQTLKQSGAQKSSPMISATHGVEVVNGEQVLDIEFLVAVDRKLELDAPYSYKEELKLVNALYTRYVGNPAEIQGAVNELFAYISNNGLQQITALYNVNVNDDKVQAGETPIVDLYIGLNPNVT